MKSIKIVFAIVLLLNFSQSFASQKTICGRSDDRLPSLNVKVGRVIKPGATSGCTITMIGRSCAVTAGHCSSTFYNAEFNVPASENGRIRHPEQKDIYPVDRDNMQIVDRGIGNDWAVLRLGKNSETGSYPGDVQGFYPVKIEGVPADGSVIRITGYGRDDEPTRNFAQQTHTGPIYRINRSRGSIHHQADTMGGNSGSSVILESTQEIIGIHTHGGCSTRSSSANSSTLISANTAMKAAIASCLEYEQDLE